MTGGGPPFQADRRRDGPEKPDPALRILVISDFDGTISTVDVGNSVLNRFTARGWEEIDRAYCAGEIGSQVAYSRIAPCLRGSREQLLEYVSRHARLDPHFPAFCLYCRERGMDLKIVSDGFDFYIDDLLGQHSLVWIERFANAVAFEDGGRMAFLFPHANPECGRCGTCKTAILERHRPSYDRIIYIGNGHSDVCPSKKADLVFAKDQLHEACLKDGRSFIPYKTFGDIETYLMQEDVP